jgi:hypothetical protein
VSQTFESARTQPFPIQKNNQIIEICMSFILTLTLPNQIRKYHLENNQLENISTCQNKMNLENKKTKMACMGPPPSGASWKHYFSG